MNKPQQMKFVYFFDELCETQEILEHLKIDLTHHKDYNPHLLFERLSQGYNEISIEQMRNYLIDRIACNQRELYQIFQKFDSRRNGFITRQDFIRQMIPLKKSVHYGQREGQVSAIVQSSFLQIFIEILKRFRIVQQARRQVGLIPPYDAFAHVDYWKKGIIGIGQLKKFYNDNDFDIGEQSLYFLLHALRRRYHRNVSLQLFCQTLNPLELGEYPGYSQQLNGEKERQFLKRSRRQEQAVKRSRIDNQMLQYEVQREQRRGRADLQRQLNLEQRINSQLANYDRTQQDNIRRALLQQEISIRSQGPIQNSFLDKESRRLAQQSRRISQTQALRQRQRLMNDNLTKQILRQQLASETARRKVVDNQRAIRQEIQREKQTHQWLSKTKQLQINRQRLQLDSLRERQGRMRQIELQKLRNSQYDAASYSRSIKQSRIQDLQGQLQRTRAQMKQRRERLELEDKLRGVRSTSTKSRAQGFPF